MAKDKTVAVRMDKAFFQVAKAFYDERKTTMSGAIRKMIEEQLTLDGTDWQTEMDKTQEATK